MNLGQMLGEAARKYRHKTALSMGDQRLSFIELDEASNKFANALIGLGVQKGDRVAMLLSNTPEFVTVYFGIVKCGAIAVPLDTKYKLTELKSLFADCQPVALIGEDTYLQPLTAPLAEVKSLKHIIDVNCNGAGQSSRFGDMLAAGSAPSVAVAISDDDVAHIAYTSGASLFPKGVVLPHKSLCWEAQISGDGFAQTDKDKVVLFALPMHHAFGLIVILFTSILKGSELVIIPAFSINSLFDTIEKQKITVYHAVPFVHSLVVNQAEEKGISHDLSSLRLCGSAGSALPVDVARRFQKHFGMRIVDFWGQTEASAHITCTALDGSSQFGHVGKALPGWELRIVDADGRDVAVGQRGELIARGPIMKGIYNHPEITARMIRNGWLYTGDIGEFDSEGNVHLHGNNKGMFIVKGQNIFPGDVEKIVLSHQNVAEAVVVGAPDDIRGSIVRAAVKVKAGKTVTEQEIKRLCMEHLASYKVPKQVVFLDSWPRTADGNIDKDVIKKMPVAATVNERD